MPAPARALLVAGHWRGCFVRCPRELTSVTVCIHRWGDGGLKEDPFPEGPDLGNGSGCSTAGLVPKPQLFAVTPFCCRGWGPGAGAGGSSILNTAGTILALGVTEQEVLGIPGPGGGTRVGRGFL